MKLIQTIQNSETFIRTLPKVKVLMTGKGFERKGPEMLGRI
jgi:hypothetical protein